jgi:hypothetical protein
MDDIAFDKSLSITEVSISGQKSADPTELELLSIMIKANEGIYLIKLRIQKTSGTHSLKNN